MTAVSATVQPAWRRYVDLLAVLTAKEIKVRYKRTVLGYLWSLLNPVIYATTFWIAFKAILNVRIESYFTFLLAGLFPWQWFANTLQAAPSAFVRNATLVKKVAFPRHLIVASVVLTEGVHFVLCLPVFAVFEIAYSQNMPHLSWLWGVPVLTAIQATTKITSEVSNSGQGSRVSACTMTRSPPKATATPSASAGDRAKIENQRLIDAGTMSGL